MWRVIQKVLFDPLMSYDHFFCLCTLDILLSWKLQNFELFLASFFSFKYDSTYLKF